MDEKKFAIKETVSAEEVKMLRKKLGLTQRDFAGLLGCSKPTVERLEREGTVTKGPMALLMKLLDRDAESHPENCRFVYGTCIRIRHVP